MKRLAPIATTPAAPDAGPRRSPDRVRVLAQVTRYLGALALLAVGVSHIQQYAVDYYDAIPTIGTLFALNFASAVIVTLGLVAPIARITGRRADAVLALLAVGGIGIAAGSLAGLFVSESAGLFGFMEQGYRSAIVVAIALEAATIVLLGLFLAAMWVRRRADRRPAR